MLKKIRYDKNAFTGGMLSTSGCVLEACNLNSYGAIEDAGTGGAGGRAAT